MKKLQTIGNSVGAIIDKSLLDVLRVDRDTPFEFEIKDGDLVIHFDRVSRRKQVRESIDKVMTKHAGLMRKLAK